MFPYTNVAEFPWMASKKCRKGYKRAVYLVSIDRRGGLIHAVMVDMCKPLAIQIDDASQRARSYGQKAEMSLLGSGKALGEEEKWVTTSPMRRPVVQGLARVLWSVRETGGLRRKSTVQACTKIQALAPNGDHPSRWLISQQSESAVSFPFGNLTPVERLAAITGPFNRLGSL